MSVIGDILAYAARTGAINFGPGLPDNNLLPVDEIKKALEELDNKNFNYSPYGGDPQVIEEIKKFLGKRGIEREVIITSGAQEAIALVGLYLKGKKIRMGNPVYLEALTSFKELGAHVLPTSMDERGELPLPADAYYVIPTGHNPRGTTMDRERREAFATLPTLLVEDGTYDLIFYGEAHEPIASMREDSIYIFSFSKILSPGLRIGVLAVPENIYKDILRLRSVLNICAPTPFQHVVGLLLERGVVERASRRAREVYRQRRDMMVKYLRDVAEFSLPSAGFFVWARFPFNAWKILELSKKRGVVFIPGEPFYVSEADPNTARLSFSFETPERIREGTRILAEVIKSI